MTDSPSDETQPEADATQVLPAAETETPETEAEQPQAATRHRKRRRWPAIVVGSLLVLLGGAYVVGYFAAGDTVPRRTSVAGVEIGGLSRKVAEAKLDTELGAKASAPLTVTFGSDSKTLQPADAGLSLDAQATVEQAGVGRSWAPVHIWRVLTGGGPIDPVAKVDEAKLDTAVGTLATSAEKAAVDAQVAYDGANPVVKPGEAGVAVDRKKTAEAISTGYLESTTIAGTSSSVAPKVTTAAAEEVVTSYARPATSGPITLDLGKGTLTVTPEQIAAATTFPVADGAIKPATDIAALYQAAQPAIQGMDLGAAKDARIAIGASGKPEITPSVDGVTLTAEDFTAAVTPLITKTDGRSAKPNLGVSRPAFTTEMAQALKVNEVTGEFTTYYPHAAYRNTNLGRAAQTMTNTLLKPGETFSLNKVLGERTAANGYVEGYVIQSGVLVKELGGGVSQSATTVYNAMFFAGLKDVEHHPHMFYIDRYPAGREATVYYGSLDLRFQNDTDYGVLVQAVVSPSSPGKQGSITVRMWSTKTYDKIESTDLVKSNFTDPRTITSNSPTCEPQSSTQGFDVRYSRLFYRGGQVVKKEDFFWRYAPEDRIVCQR